MAQSNMAGGTAQPIIEVDGKLRFSLPGQPLFPPLDGDTILKPTIDWKINADKAGKLNAELAYVTGGMSWEADYNVVAPENNDLIDLVGWVTMDNQSGKTFENAKIKLMAGDVSKIQPGAADAVSMLDNEEMAARSAVAPVSEKSFEDYHLYTLARPATLRDSETKQVEFHSRGQCAVAESLRLRRDEGRLAEISRLLDGEHAQQSGAGHRLLLQGGDDARVQELRGQSSRDADAERAGAFLQTG